MKKVYILNNAGHDYSSAGKFGELVFLDISEKAKWDIARLYSELREGMKEAEAGDLLLISSLTTHCCVATAILVEWYGRVNFLIYKNDQYEEKKLFTDESLTHGITEVGELGN